MKYYFLSSTNMVEFCTVDKQIYDNIMLNFHTTLEQPKALDIYSLCQTKALNLYSLPTCLCMSQYVTGYF